MNDANGTNEKQRVDRSVLKYINGISIDPGLPRTDRIRSFISQIGDPYCYLDGDMVVKIRYVQTDVSFEDRLKAYACEIV